MAISVETVSYEDLPDEIEKDSFGNFMVSDNGSGKEYATYILIYDGDELMDWYSDAMEPEDATFYRDLNWIPGVIEWAYKMGKTENG